MNPVGGKWAFTCLLPVHGADDPIRFAAAAASIAANTTPPDRVLVCQDGPLPSELEDAVARTGWDVARNPGAKGLHHNLNHALGEVRTPWAARADADDINRPRRFETQLDFLRAHPEVAVVGAAIEEHDRAGRKRVKPAPLTHRAIVRRARWRNPINHMTVMFSVEAVRAAGGYPAIPFKEDYALWLRMIEGGYRFGNVAECLVDVTLGANFPRRRAGPHNIASEWALWRARRRGLGLGAGLIHALRAGALAWPGAARLAYAPLRRR